ncbi:sec-independent protein translocase protein TatA [Aquimarina brevivitae]|uniref:Sec-independent protein translocase protein TatA n=2 Tax=Aquimarina brevivitae TaxID=323412 RepID=A0A4Q7PFR8_9FLAO|nr:sec-independent protein translocase protein TatA [Aquimarina brevivitae]
MIFLVTLYFKLKIMMSLNIILGMFGPWQIALIVVVVLLLFGGKKIPELMRGLGSGIKEFKDASKDEEEDNAKIDDKK